jgi:PKD repeat protein
MASGGSGRVTGRHVYAAPGSYVVSLTVTDREGDAGQSAPLTVVVG